MTSLGLQAACPSHLTLCRLMWSAMLTWLVRASSSAVSGPRSVWAAVEAHHLPQAAIVEGLQLCPLHLGEGP